MKLKLCIVFLLFLGGCASTEEREPGPFDYALKPAEEHPFECRQDQVLVCERWSLTIANCMCQWRIFP